MPRTHRAAHAFRRRAGRQSRQRARTPRTHPGGMEAPAATPAPLSSWASCPGPIASRTTSAGGPDGNRGNGRERRARIPGEWKRPPPHPPPCHPGLHAQDPSRRARLPPAGRTAIAATGANAAHAETWVRPEDDNAWGDLEAPAARPAPLSSWASCPGPIAPRTPAAGGPDGNRGNGHQHRAPMAHAETWVLGTGLRMTVVERETFAPNTTVTPAEVGVRRRRSLSADGRCERTTGRARPYGAMRSGVSSA